MAIPLSFNLKNEDYVFSTVTVSLASSHMEFIKNRSFFCDTVDSDANFINCLTCPHADTCVTHKLDVSIIGELEFVLDRSST